MDSEFRSLTDHERALLEKLLELHFPGRDELRQQMSSVTAKQVMVDGTLRLKCDPNPRAPVKCRVPTQGWCPDADGVRINVLLHVVDGAMRELEIFKDDSSEIRRPPSPSELVLFTPYGEAGVWGAAEPGTGGL
jgi:uncharacterized protein DUF6984